MMMMMIYGKWPSDKIRRLMPVKRHVKRQQQN